AGGQGADRLREERVVPAQAGAAHGRRGPGDAVCLYAEIRLAIGYSLATRQMLDASIPAPKPARRSNAAPLPTKPQTPVKDAPAGRSAGAVQAACTHNAKEVSAPAIIRGQGALCVA
ncbi:MAG: hypothetical protein EAZ36_02370, partial [Verrucomicrobia bacterium]